MDAAPLSSQYLLVIGRDTDDKLIVVSLFPKLVIKLVKDLDVVSKVEDRFVLELRVKFHHRGVVIFNSFVHDSDGKS